MSKETRDIYDRFNGIERDAQCLLIVLDQHFFCARSSFEERIFRRFVYVIFIYEEYTEFYIEFAQNLYLYTTREKIFQIIEQGGSSFKRIIHLDHLKKITRNI